MSSKKKSVSRKRLYGVLLPVGAGKTKLSNFVHGKKGKKNVIFIDVDTNLKIDRGRNSIEYFPKIKLMIEKTYRTYSKYKIVVVSSNQQLLGFLKIPAKNVFTYVPEVYFFLKMLTVRKLLNPPFADTELGEELETEVEQKALRKKESRGKSVSLGVKREVTQSSLEIIEEDDIVDLYDQEMKTITNSRTSMLKRKHTEYSSFEQLFGSVMTDVLKHHET